jgi:hypothetical protein
VSDHRFLWNPSELHLEERELPEDRRAEERSEDERPEDRFAELPEERLFDDFDRSMRSGLNDRFFAEPRSDERLLAVDRVGAERVGEDARDRVASERSDDFFQRSTLGTSRCGESPPADCSPRERARSRVRVDPERVSSAPVSSREARAEGLQFGTEYETRDEAPRPRLCGADCADVSRSGERLRS